MTNSTASKQQLLQEIRGAHTQLEQTLSQYDDKQMTELRDEAGWSIKDHLDHLAVWQEGVATLLERRPRYARFEAMGVDVATVEASTEDELNAIIRERTARPTLADTRTFLRQSQEHLLHALSGLSEDALLRGYSYFQPDFPDEDSGRPITAWVTGNSNAHYREHLPWIQAIAARQA